MDGLIRRRAAVPSPGRDSASTRLADAPRHSAETAPARFAHAKVSKGPIGWGAEWGALIRQGWLIGTRPVRGPLISLEGDRCAVFVHGWMAAGAVFDPLRLRVHRDLRVGTADFTYASMGRFEDIAARLGQALRSLASERRLALVGHSMGGLLCRWVMQEEAVDAELLVTLATPHAGTLRARRFPTELARAIRPKSQVLRRLRQPRYATRGHCRPGRDRLVRATLERGGRGGPKCTTSKTSGTTGSFMRRELSASSSGSYAPGRLRRHRRESDPEDGPARGCRLHRNGSPVRLYDGPAPRRGRGRCLRVAPSRTSRRAWSVGRLGLPLPSSMTQSSAP